MEIYVWSCADTARDPLHLPPCGTASSPSHGCTTDSLVQPERRNASRVMSQAEMESASIWVGKASWCRSETQTLYLLHLLTVFSLQCAVKLWEESLFCIQESRIPPDSSPMSIRPPEIVCHCVGTDLLSIFLHQI